MVAFVRLTRRKGTFFAAGVCFFGNRATTSGIGFFGGATVAVLYDESVRPVFPRWFAFFNFWSALLLIPASMITYFKTGPFAWNGILGFYLGVAIFTLWCLVTFWMVRKDILYYEGGTEKE